MIKVVEQVKIIEAIETLGGINGGWASLTDLRKMINLSHQDQNAMIIEMVLMGTLTVIPWDNQKVLTREDHQAALYLGGQPNHMIQIC